MHWTYEPFKEDSDLCQGDILEPSDALKAIFQDVHSHFTNEKYRGFLVLSQTCDLVRREGEPCGATHISLSVIRSLQDIISDSLRNNFGYLAPGVYNQGIKKSVENLAERLVNQNEYALGLFYLHPCLDSGITVGAVAVLRVSISLKSSLHYETLRASRVGRLNTNFQAKLGWMVGNLYSRVGVPDWKENADEGVEGELLKKILAFSREEPLWLDKNIYKKIIGEEPNFENLPTHEQNNLIEKYKPVPPKDKILEIIGNTVKNIAPKITEEHLSRIKQRLSNNEQFNAQMRKIGRS